MVAFTSGYGAITTPEQAQKRRALAESLIGRSETPGRNWAEGLSDVAAALTGTVLQREVDEAERAAREELGGLFGGLSSGSSEQDLIGVLSNPWANDGERYVAQTLFNSQFGGNSGDVRSFGTPIWGTGPDGSTVFGTLDNAGNFNVVDTPEGFQFGKEPIRLDTGTEYTLLDPVTRQLIGTVPKNTEAESFADAFGTSAGKAAAEKIQQLPGLVAKTNNMLSTIDGILNDPAMDYSTGWLSWMQAVPGTDQYRFGQRALQLQGQAFLQAFESLKGAGQITEVEGNKATQAIGRLSTAQSPEDYRNALNELKEVIEESKKRAINEASAAGGVQPQPLPSPEDIQALTDKWLNQ